MAPGVRRRPGILARRCPPSIRASTSTYADAPRPGAAVRAGLGVRSGRSAEFPEALEPALLEDLEKTQVHAPRERGPLRDERREAADRVGAGLEGGERLGRRVDAARGDQPDARTDGPAKLPDGLEHRREELRSREAARSLREPRLVDALRVAEVERV